MTTGAARPAILCDVGHAEAVMRSESLLPPSSRCNLDLVSSNSCLGNRVGLEGARTVFVVLQIVGNLLSSAAVWVNLCPRAVIKHTSARTRTQLALLLASPSEYVQLILAAPAATRADITSATAPFQRAMQLSAPVAASVSVPAAIAPGVRKSTATRLASTMIISAYRIGVASASFKLVKTGDNSRVASPTSACHSVR